jgi:hypothetical protein
VLKEDKYYEELLGRDVKRLFTATGFAMLSALDYKSPVAVPAMEEEPETIVFFNVSVIPMDTERVLENQIVIVEGDRIVVIGPVEDVEVPEGAEIIEGNGAYLMPGLADLHMHIVSAVPGYKGPDQLRLFLAEGVTTIRNFSAMPEHQAWRDEVARGELGVEIPCSLS